MTRKLYASRPTELYASALTSVEVDAASRTLSGLILPVGEVGYTSAGPVEVAADATGSWPDQLDRIKLLPVHTHDDPRANPIGYATAVRRVPEGWRAAFYVPEGPEGDEALRLAASRLKDGFSVELVGLAFNSRGQLASFELSAVAHVPIPAFTSARHDGMAASRNTNPTGDTVNPLTDDERNRLRELLAVAPAERTDEQNAEAAELLARATVDELAELTAPQEDPAPVEQPQPQAVAASRRHATAPAMPGSRRRTSTPARRDVRELFAAQARVFSGVSRPELEAALSDITMTDNIWTAQDEYAGQLWSGVTYQRRFVQNSVPGPLNAIRGVGWRWVTKPAVADYAGDKAAVPSNAVETEATEWLAARLAGAHDIDRAHWDFGNTEFIEAYYEALTEDYALKSDLKALAFQLSSATALVGAETSLFRAAAVAAQAVEDNTNGQPADFIYISGADKLGLLDITEADVPAYLAAFGVTPDKFQTAPGLAAGTVVAGTKQATKFRELSSSPIRVEAVNIANGGIDGGVFGYYATEELFEGGIVSKTFA